MEPEGRAAVALVCPACGATPRRASAHFCATCGRGLREHTYAPADSLLASYHQQHSRPAMLIEQEMNDISDEEEQRWITNALSDDPRHNMLTVAAFVFAVAALVPFVGILFCPCVVVLGALGLRNARRDAHLRGERRAIYSMVLGVVIFGAQVFLLWLFFLIGNM
jgi:hypothetical protein